MLKRLWIACALSTFFLFCIVCIWFVQRTSQRNPTGQQAEWVIEREFMSPNQKTSPNYSSPATHVIISGDVGVRRVENNSGATNDGGERFHDLVEWFIKFLIDIKITDAF